MNCGIVYEISAEPSLTNLINTIDSHLANYSTQNAFSTPVNATFYQLPSNGKIYKLRFCQQLRMKTWKYTVSSDTSIFAMSVDTVLQAYETSEGLLTCPVLISEKGLLSMGG